MHKKLTEQGLKYLEAGQFDKAAQILSLLVKSSTDNADAHHMLGIIELERGNFDVAYRFVTTAVNLSKNNSLFYNTMGNIEIRRQQYKQAEQAFLLAIQYNPDKIEYKYNLAHFYLSQDKYQKAIDFYYSILNINPTHYLSIRGIIVCYLFSNEPEIALEHATELVQEFSIYDEPYYYLGLCHYATNNITAALHAYDNGIALNPNNYDILTAISACYRSMANFSIAETYLLKSLNLEPNNPTAMYNLASIKLEQNKLDIAKKMFINTLALDENYAEPICGLGQIESINGNHSKALEYFHKANQIAPLNPKPLMLYATTLLRQQFFSKGWPAYRATFIEPNILRAINAWNGEKLNESHTLLVWVPKENYDLGQQILFISMLPDLQHLAKKIIVLCDASIIEILDRSFPSYTFLSELNTRSNKKYFNEITHQIALNALGQFLRKDESSFKNAKTGYLKCNIERSKQYREKYQQLFHGKKLVGISWRATTQSKAIDYAKSINLQDLMPILKKDNCQFISLQSQHSSTSHPEIFVDPETDVSELAEQMYSLDLILSIDNNIAHLAAALGLDTYVIISAYAEWYWFENSSQSLYYSTAKLFRQRSKGTWTHPITEVTKLI